MLKNRLIKGMLFLFAGLLLIPAGKILAGPGGPLIRVAFRPPNEQQPFSFRRDAPAGLSLPHTGSHPAQLQERWVFVRGGPMHPRGGIEHLSGQRHLKLLCEQEEIGVAQFKS